MPSSDHIPPRLDLPIPRLEIVFEELPQPNHYVGIWHYRLVLRHLLGHVHWLALGATQTSATLERAQHDGPIRDGVHLQFDSRQLNLPGYVIIADRAYATKQGEWSWYWDAMRGNPTLPDTTEAA